MNPEGFTVEDMKDLCTKRWKPKARKLFRIIPFGNRREMIEHKSEAGMSPAMQLTDADESEQEKPPYGPN